MTRIVLTKFRSVTALLLFLSGFLFQYINCLDNLYGVFYDLFFYYPIKCLVTVFCNGILNQAMGPYTWLESRKKCQLLIISRSLHTTKPVTTMACGKTLLYGSKTEVQFCTSTVRTVLDNCHHCLGQVQCHTLIYSKM